MDYDFDRVRARMTAEDWITIALVHRRDATTFDARNAFAFGGVVEDPATGAAAAAFGAYLRALELVEPPVEITIHQGDDMGRPSLLDGRHRRRRAGASRHPRQRHRRPHRITRKIPCRSRGFRGSSVPSPRSLRRPPAPHPARDRPGPVSRRRAGADVADRAARRRRGAARRRSPPSRAASPPPPPASRTRRRGSAASTAASPRASPSCARPRTTSSRRACGSPACRSARPRRPTSCPPT